MENNMTFIIIM